MKQKSILSLLNKAPADPGQWAEKSQRSVAAYFMTEYTDEQYECRHCKASATFAALDQKYTYEVRKADVNQRRRLCEPCWRESLRIAKELASQADAWKASKKTLRADRTFMANWLRLLELRETYIPYRQDVARKNMLRKLLREIV